MTDTLNYQSMRNSVQSKYILSEYNFLIQTNGSKFAVKLSTQNFIYFCSVDTTYNNLHLFKMYFVVYVFVFVLLRLHTSKCKP